MMMSEQQHQEFFLSSKDHSFVASPSPLNSMESDTTAAVAPPHRQHHMFNSMESDTTAAVAPPHRQHHMFNSSSALAKGKRTKRVRDRFSDSHSETPPMNIMEDVSDLDEEEEEQAAARCLLLMMHSVSPASSDTKPTDLQPKPRTKKKPKKFEDELSENNNINMRVYECKSCGKGFMSFQALGGHRATCQNKMRPFGPQEEEIKRPKIHECPICHRIFPSGQALGGHRRTHSTTPPPASLSEPVSSYKTPSKLMLDLNVPAAEEEAENYSVLSHHVSSYQPWWSTTTTNEDAHEEEVQSPLPRGLRPTSPSRKSLFMVATVN